MKLKIPMAEYLAMKGHISATDVKDVLKSRLLYQSKREEPDESSKAQNLGTAFHTALLEPELFKSEVVEKCEHKKGSKAYNAWLDALPNKNAAIITPDEMKAVKTMLWNTHRSNLGFLFTGGEAEVTFTHEDKDGEFYRARADYVLETEHTVLCVDLKTTSNMHWFKYDAIKYGYDISAVHYERVLTPHFKKPVQYVLVAVETAKPYDNQWFIFGPDKYERAEEKYEKGLALLKERHSWEGWLGVATDEPEEI